jgi:hypothetical protein
MEERRDTQNRSGALESYIGDAHTRTCTPSLVQAMTAETIAKNTAGQLVSTDTKRPAESGTPEQASSVEQVSTVEREIEHGGPPGPEPTRYGDWERKGRCIDF